jgi:Fe-S oxidoreductase
VPPARIAEATTDLRALLGRHGFIPGVAGHASAGNLHFVLSSNFGEQADLERYDAFIHELVELIDDKYDGSLKAEHGTGLNMAPFVSQPAGLAVLEALRTQYEYGGIQTCAADGMCSRACPVGIDTGALIRGLRQSEHGERGERAGHPTLPEALVPVSARAGLPLWIPDGMVGHCCGTPWSSKGYRGGHRYMARKSAAALARWSEHGRPPVVIDASSCAYGLVSEAELDGISVLDSTDWAHDYVLARLEIPRKLRTALVHATCASDHLGSSSKLTAIAARLADEVIVPAATGCCGMAGDRGWLHPELPASALRDVARELGSREFDVCLSSNRTCEVALQEVTGRRYASFVLAVEELTRGATATG